MINAQAPLKAGSVNKIATECLKAETKEISTAQEEFFRARGRE